MSNAIYLQDPSWDASEYLLDSMLNACKGANAGAASFAFVSAGGVKLLLRNEVFRRYLNAAPFELVVGMDAVTNTAAIAELNRVAEQYDGFSCRAFIGTSDGGLFHPKLSWFRRRSGITALVGSGNLTAGGLRGNHEAFSSIELKGKDRVAWQTRWSTWIARHNEELYSLDSRSVIERAAENDRAPRPLRRKRDPVEESANGRLTVGPLNGESAIALIAEIPRGAERWGQGNFDLETFTSFFGATPEYSRVLLLTSINLDGTNGDLEERPSIASRSSNYRFELSATRGLAYPETGRPTALFVRIAARTFRYRLLMPGQREHREIARFLDENVGLPGRNMRRMIVDWARIETAGFAQRLVL